jgi:hypothetical protein
MVSADSKAHFFVVHSPRSIETLHQSTNVSDCYGVAHGSNHHASHGQPHVGQRLGRITAWEIFEQFKFVEPNRSKRIEKKYFYTITNAKHVRQRFEQSYRVLFGPIGVLGGLFFRF